jgi:uncharacterized RmlC-like cupin family protein
VKIIDRESTGNEHISLEYVRLPKGAESYPHLHVNTHTAVYTLQGEVKLYYGDRLENVVVVGKHDCVYIPPNVIHYVVNERDEEMISIVARTPSHHEVKEFKELFETMQPAGQSIAIHEH